MTVVETLHNSGALLAESPQWHMATRSILWIDLLRPRLFRHDPASGETDMYPIDLPAPLGAIVASDDPDRLIVSARNGLSVVRLSGNVESRLFDPEGGRDEIAYNDSKMDRFGRLWIGTHHLAERDPRGALWCIEPGGVPRLADVGFAVSNGPAVSPDGRLLYFNDSVGRRTFVYDLDRNDPLPRNRRVFAEYAPEEGFPDGITVDDAGGVWVAHWGGSRVTRFSPTGCRTKIIRLPCPNVTAVAFAGDNLDVLVVTTARDGLSAAELSAHPQAGNVFACSPGDRGLPEPLFPMRRRS